MDSWTAALRNSTPMATAPLQKASNLSQGAYGRPNSGKNYLYFRAVQKEPFDSLYFSPALTVIENLDDRSRSLVP